MIQREVPEEPWLKTEKYLKMYNWRSSECLSFMSLSSCPEIIQYFVVQLLHSYLKVPWVCCSHSANLCFCASFTVHFFHLIASFQKWGRRGERGNKSKKAYPENAFSDQSNLSRKPSGRGADWKLRITSYESQVKSHKDWQIKAASAPLSLCFMGVNAEKNVQAALVTLLCRKNHWERDIVTIWIPILHNSECHKGKIAILKTSTQQSEAFRYYYATLLQGTEAWQQLTITSAISRPPSCSLLYILSK